MSSSPSEVSLRQLDTAVSPLTKPESNNSNDTATNGVPLHALGSMDNQDGLSLTRQEINRLILEYLVVEGYKDVAEKFSRETGILEPVTELHVAGASLSDRMWIREAVLLRKIEDVIDTVNRLWPELFDKNPFIYFQVSLIFKINCISSLFWFSICMFMCICSSR